MLDKTFTHIYIMVTHGCNFACEYCFNHDIGQTKISLDQAKKAVDILVENSPPNEQLSISFFGGEPLIGMDIVIGVKNYCKEKYRDRNWHFGATSNFSNLSKEVWEEVVLDPNFSMLVSLDGNSFHNKHRVLKDGSPTFDIVYNNLMKIKNNPYLKDVWNRFQIRCTFPSSDVNTIYDRTMFMLNNFGKQYVIMNVDEDDWTKVSYDEYKTDIIKVIAEAEKRKDPDIIKNIKFFYDSMIAYKNRLLGINYMEKSCGQAMGQFAIDYTGNISPCHRFTNISMHTDKWVIGNLETGLDEEKVNYIKELDSKKINSCVERKCKRFGNCAFGCFASGVSCSPDYSAQCNGQDNILFNMFEYNNRIIEELLESDEHLPAFYWLFGYDVKQKLMNDKIRKLSEDNEKLKEIMGKLIPVLDDLSKK